jgi:hypothetical protein
MRFPTNFVGARLAARAVAMAVAILATSATGGAQAGPPGPPPPGGDMFYARVVGSGPIAAGDAMGFVAFEAGLGGKTVTGAPFTASFSQQSTQVLADGNRIERTTSGTLARDSNGRTRREMTLPAIGPWAISGKTPPHVVFINDPVAGVNYVLQLDKKIARKLTVLGKQPQTVQIQGNRPLPGFAQEVHNESTTESLGSQTMGGLTVQGTKTTRTIPAGAIGNEKPIVITVERWYSPDLQMNVLIKRSDPRTGDNVFQLTNIQQGEPDASLFQVPSDYTVKQGGRRVMIWNGSGAPPPPPPPPGPQN